MRRLPNNLSIAKLCSGWADKQARLTAEALVAAHVGRSNKVNDLNFFVEALTIALIAARAEGREMSS